MSDSTNELADLERKLKASEQVGYGYGARRKAIQARIDELRAADARAEMRNAG